MSAKEGAMIIVICSYNLNVLIVINYSNYFANSKICENAIL